MELLDKKGLVIEIKEGKVFLKLDTSGVDVTVALDAEYFVDKLTDAIPGEIDDALAAMLLAKIK